MDRHRCLEHGMEAVNDKVLCRCKANTHDPNSYSGIALEGNTFKIFTKNLTKRLIDLVGNRL